MYHALKGENPKISPGDARGRIERDCNGIWSRRTILEALPDEAKNPVKQKAGQLGQKGLKSVAFSAARVNPYLLGPHKGSECVNCQELLSENRDLKEALTKTTVFTQAYEIASHYPQYEHYFSFEFSIPLEDIRKYIESLNMDNCWFNATIDTNSGKLVSATVGRSIQEETVKGFKE